MVREVHVRTHSGLRMALTATQPCLQSWGPLSKHSQRIRQRTRRRGGKTWPKAFFVALSAHNGTRHSQADTEVEARLLFNSSLPLERLLDGVRSRQALGSAVRYADPTWIIDLDEMECTV